MTDQHNNPAPNRTTNESLPSAAAPHGDTKPLHELELETIASLVRQPVEEDAFSQESACIGAVKRIKQLGHDPLTDDLGPNAASPTDAPARLGQYRLLDKLGEGGMGAVYRAVHERLEKVVALKILPAGRVPDPEAVARFTREMKAVGRLNHPNIVGAFDAGEADGVHYLVMELVEGLDVGTICRQLGPLPVAAACEIVRQAAEGLSHAHACGLVHRDVKPSNLMLSAPLSPEGGAAGGARANTAESITVKILDLGLARLGEQQTGGSELTSSGQMMGTFEYMAPEQGSDSHTVDARADVYSLGATLYKLLTGHAPFAGEKYDTPLKRMMALATEDPTPIRQLRPETPKALARLLHRMLEKNPDRRVQSAAELAELLTPFADGRQLFELLARASEAAPGYTVAPPSTDTERAASASLEDTAPTSAGSQLSPQQREATAVITSGGRSATRSSSWFPPRRRWLLAAASGFAAIVVLGVLLSVRTPKGTVVVEVPPGGEDNVQIVVKQGGEVVEILDADHGWTARVKEGKYEIDVAKGGDQFQVADNTLTVSRDQKARVRVAIKAPLLADRSGTNKEPSRPLSEHASHQRDSSLIPAIDVLQDVRQGFWKLDGEELSGEKGICLLPVAIDGEYTLSGEVTWESEEGAFGVLLPVGLGRTSITMGHDGAVKMFAVGGCEKEIRKSGDPLLTRGQRYQFEAVVRRDGNHATIVVLLDGKSQCVWEGDCRTLGSPIREVYRPAVITTGSARFHRLNIEKHSGTVPPLGSDRFVALPFEKGPSEMEGGPVRYDLAPEGWVLVGLRVRDNVQHIQPIYRKDGKHLSAEVSYPYGGTDGFRDFDVAKAGYAVGGFRCSFDWRQTTILQIVYMKDLGNGRLDPNDTYESKAVGIYAENGEPQYTILSDGRAVVGLQTECHGPWQGFGLQGLGLLYANDPKDDDTAKTDATSGATTQKTPNLIPSIDVTQDVRHGTWGVYGEDLTGYNGSCVLPVAVNGDYTLSGELTWESDEGDLELILPVGMRRVGVRMSYDGAAMANWLNGRERPVRDAGEKLLHNGERHKFEALVRCDDRSRVTVVVDGKSQCVLEAPESAFGYRGFDPMRPAVGVQGNCRFHNLQMQSHSGRLTQLGSDRKAYLPFDQGPSARMSGNCPWFFNPGPTGSVLVGMRAEPLGDYKPGDFQLIFRKEGKVSLASRTCRGASGVGMCDVGVAKDGYALGGIRCNVAHCRWNACLQLIFMKDIGGGRLDPHDRYESPIYGSGKPNEEILSDGQALVGIYGDIGHDSQVIRLGLLYAKPPAAANVGSKSPTVTGQPFPADGTVEEKKAWLVAELKRLNPGFDGQLVVGVEDGRIVKIGISRQPVKNIQPLALLDSLHTCDLTFTQVENLEPLRGLPIRSMDLNGSAIRDLSALRDCPIESLQVTSKEIGDEEIAALVGTPIKELGITGTRVSGLAAIAGLQLENLHYCNTGNVKDLGPLKGMPIRELAIHRTPVTDLLPLKGMPIDTLELEGTSVTDLSPLVNSPLKKLHVDGTKVTDLRPLLRMPLEQLRVEIRGNEDIAILRQIKTLKTINGKPAAEVLKEAEKKLKESSRGEEPSPGKPFPDQGSVEEKKAWVIAELKRLNPGFDGSAEFRTDGGEVVGLSLDGKQVGDITPVRYLKQLQEFNCARTRVSDLSPLKGLKLQRLVCTDARAVFDLSPLSGMPLTVLECNFTAISSLEPLRGMKLVRLFCGDSKVSDLSPLAGMPLEHLEFRTTAVADLSPLTGMPLTKLECSFTRIDDLFPLQGMKLTYLDVMDTKIRDLAVLRDMPLKTLLIRATKIRDLSSLKGMQLTSLNCSWMPIADLSPLAGMPLQSLTVCNTQVSDLSPLAPMPLHFLEMPNTQVGDLSPLRKCPLEAIVFDYHPQRDAAVLRQIRTLKTINGKPAAEVLAEETSGGDSAESRPFPASGTLTQQRDWLVSELKRLNPEYDGKLNIAAADGQIVKVDLNGGKITDISPLAALKKLESFSAAGTPLSSLAPLAGLPITSISVRHCEGLFDIGPLRQMPLKTVQVGETAVTDLSPLAGKELESLDVYKCRIADFGPLSGMPLKTLNVGDTRFGDCSVLAGAPLEDLDLLGCPVKDLSPLADNRTLQKLNLGWSSVTDLAPLRDVPLRILHLNARDLDLSPLKDVPLTTLEAVPQECIQRNAAVLRAMPKLKSLNRKAPAEVLGQAPPPDSSRATESEDKTEP